MAIITGTSSADLLNGTPAADAISGLGGNDTLRGAGGNDTLKGGGGRDSLLGGAGRDILIGGSGADRLVGGGGNDLYTITSTDTLVDSAGIDTVRAGFSYTLLSGFENLVLLGSAAIDATGNAAANTLTGNGAANKLSGLGGADKLIGNGGADTLSGGGGRDTLLGGAGRDILIGGSGADRLVGGGGNDLYTITSTDTLVDSAGIDTVRAAFSYTLLSDFEKLVLLGNAAIDGTGNAAANTLTGNSAANKLSGLGGADKLIGNGGADTLSGGGGNDTLLGGNGNDVLIYQAADTQVDGGNGLDMLNISGGGVTLDLTGIANTVYTDLEVINLRGRGDNTLVLARGDVIAFSSTTNTLRVDGNAGDVVATTDAGWLHMLNVRSGAQTYAQYTNGMATLRVDVDVDRSGIDTTVSTIALSSLSGTNGFRLDGIDAGDNSGFFVSGAGDVNGDGFDDFIIGAYNADPAGGAAAGETYVVFGKASGFASSLDLAALNGANGFRLDGVDAGDSSGYSAANAGDVNGDGFDDLIIGANRADPGGDSGAGESYVVFGKASGFGSSINLSALDGTNGFRLDGIDAADYSGVSVAYAGDVNGDGFDDVIIGAWSADPGGDINAGESYVVFGKASGFASSINLALLDGSSGFRLDGIDVGDNSGFSASAAGDVNGDGFDDLIIGAYNGAPGGDAQAGESYVVFGKAAGFASSVDLAALNGANGFRLDGIDVGDHSGFSAAAAGDVNGDGFDDLIIGSWTADPGGDISAGESYVVFGKAAGFGSSINLSTLNGADGFRLDGIDASDYSGFSVTAAGDVNGDGFDDVIIGAWAADPGGDSRGGETYVVFGKAAAFTSAISLATLNGMNGFRLEGIDANDYSGRSVAAAGDVNGDGFDDLLIGAPYAAGGGDSYAGESYVVFGGDFTGAVTHLGTSGADSLTGTSAAQRFVSGQGNDTLTGGGGADVFNAGAGNDLVRVSTTAFRDVDGGSGIDTLALLGSGRTLDLTALANNKITSIEKINLTGSGNNTLELARRDLLDLSDTTNRLTVNGNAGDTVDLVGTWNDGGVSGAFHTYTQGAATILIDTDIFVT